MSHRAFPLVLGLLGLLALGCEHNPPSGPAVRPPPASGVATELAMSATSPAAPGGERLLDTSTPASTATPIPLPIPIAKKTIKPGSDENLPSWVPLSGRLTVVEAPDLAENLGLVPQGTTRSTAGRISVAEQLARPRGDAVPLASQALATREASPRRATWLASNGRVRSARRAR